MEWQWLADWACFRFTFALAYALITRTRLGRIFNYNSRILYIGGICVKAGSLTSIEEANTMRFIRATTTVPIPKVYIAFVRKGQGYIIMERIEGQILGKGWLLRSGESKDAIFAQLRDMVDQWRSIPSPTGVGVASLSGGPIRDPRDDLHPFHGPWATVADFHKQFLQGKTAADLPLVSDELRPHLQHCLDLQARFPNTPVFTHGDLSWFNIMVRGDRVVAIIDWETAGWFPVYWESLTARWTHPLWREVVGQFLTPYPDAVELYRLKCNYFGGERL